MSILIVVLIVATGFAFLVYSGYTLAGIYDRQGTNTYGKYKIKTIIKEGITYYVPVCYCGSYLWKQYWSPLYENIYPFDSCKELSNNVYGWKNKMDCIDYVENRWKNTVEKRKFEEQINNLTKNI